MNDFQDEAAMIRKGIEYASEVSEMEFTIWQALKTPAYWLLVWSKPFTACGPGH